MEYITRSQFLRAKIEDFLESSDEKRLYLDLYGSEIRRLEKRYPIIISVAKSNYSHKDQRRACLVLKVKKDAKINGYA